MTPNRDGDACDNLDLSSTTLINAMDGLAYLVALDGTILAVGEPAWSNFAIANDADALRGDAVVGGNLFNIGAEDDVLEVQKSMHDRIVESRRSSIAFEYRCDAPDMARRMRMALTPVTVNGKVRAVLYQSVVLEETPRPPMSLFEKIDRACESSAGIAMVTLCSYCHDVAWPIDAPAKERNWIEPEEYYRRGGPSDVVVSHGICDGCYSRLMGSGPSLGV